MNVNLLSVVGSPFQLPLLLYQEAHSRHPHHHRIGEPSNSWLIRFHLVHHLSLGRTSCILSAFSQKQQPPFSLFWPVLAWIAALQQWAISLLLWSWWDNNPAAAQQTSNSSCSFPMLRACHLVAISQKRCENFPHMLSFQNLLFVCILSWWACSCPVLLIMISHLSTSPCTLCSPT